MNCTVVTVKDIYGEGFTTLPTGYTYIDPFNNFRIPQAGDTFLSPKYEVCTLEEGDVTPKGPRVILKKLPVKPKFKVDDKVTFGVGDKTLEGVVCKAYVNLVGNACYEVAVTSGQRWHVTEAILSLAPSLPTPLSVYGTATPTPPKGWELGKFGKVQAWTTILSQPAWGGTPYAVTEQSFRTFPLLKDAYRFILNPIPAQPTQPAKAPEGYYFTGEYRMPKKGENYQSGVEGHLARCAINDFQEDSHFILKPLPPKPVIAGWEAVEFRCPKAGEWYVCNGSMPVQATCPTVDYADPFWILRALPKPTRWLIEVESEEKPEQITVFGAVSAKGKLRVVSVTRKP